MQLHIVVTDMLKKVVIVALVIFSVVVLGLFWRSSQFFNRYLADSGQDGSDSLANQALHSAPSRQNLDLPSARYIAPTITYDNYQSAFGPLPRSLRGTAIPVSFTLDDQGHLVVTKSIKTLIDYFLSSVGEETIEQVIERIREFIGNQLEEPARSEAIDVMERYLAYKQAIVEVEGGLADEVELEGKGSDYLAMFQLRRETRISYLGQVIYDAFFAAEDKESSYIAAQLELRANRQLSEQEKAEKLQELEQLLPPKERAHRQKEREREVLNNRIKEARELGASDDEIFQMRTEVYGYEAAERFAKAESETAAWDERFNAYRQQRQEILDSNALSDEDKAQQVDGLRSRHFSETEQLRIPTLDRMADRKTADQ